MKSNWKTWTMLAGCCLLPLLQACSNGLPSEAFYHANTHLQANQPISLPKPAHTVILVLENHAFNQILSSSNAPYIQQLATSGAVFTQSFALTHPSQPNYLMLFSGSNQGVTNDSYPKGIPFSTPNLAASLLAAGHSFTAYSEGLPSVGFTGSQAGEYASKHSPWVYWQGTGPNQLPAEVNRPFSDFPKDFSQLPDLAFVIPNLDDDMHNGMGASPVRNGDKWLHDNLDAYVQWARTHNSLLILTFDEDNYLGNNQIATLFVGPMVKPGTYNEKFGHYSLLRTLEDIYKLPYAGQSAQTPPITDCWENTP